ncbi:MAG: bifunctional oligoribonuclease/PAP phosphatase NrnA [Ignavibacteriae bacterium]|nr:MAG: bifunctional oligoribonuclease/PAP phosphatase NrnA [Ignavibacteriota bacterium]
MYEFVQKLIETKDNFILTSHVNPDGDSIGSELALYTFLKNKGKNAKIINYSATPYNYLFLDKNNIIEKFDENIHQKAINEAGAVFILDTNEYSRLKTMAPYIKESPAIKVCIDHHLGMEKNGFDNVISDIESPSTGEILYKFLLSYGNNSINKDIAEYLYTAIMTDTGSFRFPRTDAETHLITANLLDLGIDPVYIYNEVYSKSSIGRLKLLSIFLRKLTLEYDNRLIYAVMLQKEFDETGTTEYDTEGFSHHMMSIETVQIALIFTEGRNGIKVSFRSKGDIYVNELAKEFGGGGHKNAAGTWLAEKDMDNVCKRVISNAKKYIIN